MDTLCKIQITWKLGFIPQVTGVEVDNKAGKVFNLVTL